MSGKSRWNAAVVGLIMAGVGGMAQASGDMNSSLDAAVEGNYDQAIQTWLNLAADGDAMAQFNLGLAFHGGVGVERDEPLAVEWYQKAAKSGSTKAQAYLAIAYQEGWFGLAKDDRLAYYWRGLAGREQ